MRYSETKLGRANFKLQEFESINELTAYLKDTPVNKHFRGETHSSQSRDSGFSKTDSYSEAEQLLVNGWGAVAEKLAKKIPVQVVSAPVTRSKPSYGMVGGQASVPRYIQGIPTNMVDRKPVVQKQKIIILNRDISYSAGVRAHEIEEEGIKCLQIIQALENKGYRVKLNLFWVSSRDNEYLSFRMTVKKPEERLSLIKVAFPIAHPSMLRRIGFKWMEVHPTMESSSFVWGYGMPSGDTLKKVIPKGEYILPNFIHDVNSYVDGLGL